MKIPLWVRTGVSMIEKDSDTKLTASNQGTEGLINNGKNLVTRMKTYLLVSATYMWYRYKNPCEGGRYLVSETERTEDHLNKRKELMEKDRSKREMKNNETSGAPEDCKMS